MERFSEQRSLRDYVASFGTLETELNLMRHETRAGGAGIASSARKRFDTCPEYKARFVGCFE
jgi:hypothetical protein